MWGVSLEPLVKWTYGNIQFTKEKKRFILVALVFDFGWNCVMLRANSFQIFLFDGIVNSIQIMHFQLVKLSSKLCLWRFYSKIIIVPQIGTNFREGFKCFNSEKYKSETGCLVKIAALDWSCVWFTNIIISASMSRINHFSTNCHYIVGFSLYINII